MTTTFHHIDVSAWDTAIVHLPNILIDRTRRPANPDTVRELAESIKVVGLLQRPAVWLDDNAKPHLVWGRNRIEAMRLIDPNQSIEVYDVTCLSPTERKIAECAENLVRNDLTIAERKAELAKLKKLSTRNAAEKEAEDERLSEERAKATRDREAAAVRAKRVGGSGKSLSETSDKGGRPKSERRAEVERIAAEEGITPQAVNQRIAKAEGRAPKPAEPEDLDYVRLVRAWDAASPEARRKFILYIDQQRRGVA